MKHTAPAAFLFSLAALLSQTLGAGCATTSASRASLASSPAVVVDLSVSQPPYRSVEANWKHRMEQPYVYVELRGDYRATGRAFADLARRMKSQGMQPSGAPFALFYDDPGQVATADLRSRACIPVDRQVAPQAPLRADSLPGRTVVYAYVGGRYTDVPRAYHGLYAFMKTMNWTEDGPIREIYLVPPEGAATEDLIAEVQVPVGWSE